MPCYYIISSGNILIIHITQKLVCGGLEFSSKMMTFGFIYHIIVHLFFLPVTRYDYMTFHIIKLIYYKAMPSNYTHNTKNIFAFQNIIIIMMTT